MVTDNSGSSNSTSQTVTVNRQTFAPVPRFNITNVNLLTVSVDASDTTDDTGVRSYTWNWGNGASSTGSTATYTYPASGTYTITLTVIDIDDSSNSTQRSVSVSSFVKQSPVCGISSCTVSFLQVNCTSNSTDDVGITNYVWNWGNGLSVSGANRQVVSHNYSTANTFNIILTVSDGAGLTSTCSRTVTTRNPIIGSNNPPISRFGFWSDNLNINFWFGGWDTDGWIVSYFWDFGDGSNSTVIGPSRRYAAPGSYTVTLTVTDNRGATGSSSQIINVINPPRNFHV